MRIPADLNHIKDARDWAASAASEFGLTEEASFEIRLAMSEAVTNAIVHGSVDQGDSVEIFARQESDALVFEVHDVGVELSVDDPVPTPTKIGADGGVADSAEHLAEGGRGLELVSMVMDDVELARQHRGSVLRFTKRKAA